MWSSEIALRQEPCKVACAAAALIAALSNVLREIAAFGSCVWSSEIKTGAVQSSCAAMRAAAALFDVTEVRGSYATHAQRLRRGLQRFGVAFFLGLQRSVEKGETYPCGESL